MTPGRQLPFDLDEHEIRQSLAAAADWIVDFVSGLDNRPVIASVEPGAAVAGLPSEPPAGRTDLQSLMETFAREIVARSRLDGHPRFFGYVSSPGTVVGAIADLLASVLDANVTSWRSAPAATDVERHVIGWIARVLGLPGEADGLLTSGGSAANLYALATARAAALPDSASTGLGANGMRLRLYTTAETHHSIEKAAVLLGLGRTAIRTIATDDQLRMDVDDLEVQIQRDLAAGDIPFCVVGTAGTVATGSIDPLVKIAEIARAHRIWFHVDAAYGGFAALAPSIGDALQGIAAADSVAVDPHKWLYAPLDCGCVLFRDPATAARTFTEDAEYIRVIGDSDRDSFAFWDYGLELSRRFRALKLWFAFQAFGTRALGEAIEANLRSATHLGNLVEQAPDFELLAPVGLSVVCFRYVGDRTLELTDDELNESILKVLQRDGAVYLSNARVRGRFALRACIVNHRTTDRDVETVLPAVRTAAARLR